MVTQNVEPYSIVGGVPARHIRFRFSESEIKQLLDLNWWDKDIEWFIKNSYKFRDKTILNEVNE